MVQINALGDACPIPVIKTLHALQQSGIDGWRPLHTGRTRG